MLSETKLVLERIVGIDRQGNKFLILRTNPDKYYVFSGNVPEEQWKDLEEGKTYQFDYYTNKRTNNKSIRDIR